LKIKKTLAVNWFEDREWFGDFQKALVQIQVQKNVDDMDRKIWLKRGKSYGLLLIQ
jgi:hypothetical protein